MMTIRRHKDTTSYSLQVIPWYMYIHSFFSTTLSSLIMNHLWLVIVFSWWISKTYSDVSLPNCKSYHCTEVCCCLNVHPFILLCILVFPYYESSLIVFSWWVFRDTWRLQPDNYKSFHCTYVSCCLNVHPFILLCTLVFPYNESSLIVFSWWVLGDTLRQRLLLTSHSTIQKCSVV